MSDVAVRLAADVDGLTTLTASSPRGGWGRHQRGPQQRFCEAVAGLISHVRDRLPTTPLALLSDTDHVESVRAAFALGVNGYIPTSLASAVAVQAMHLNCVGGTFVPTTSLLEESGDRSPPRPAALATGFTQCRPRSWSACGAACRTS